MDFTNVNAKSHISQAAHDIGLRKYFIQVFNMMFMALMITGLVSYFASESEQMIQMLYSQSADGKIGLSGFGMLITFAPLAFVLVLSFGINKLSPNAAFMIFVTYSAVMGLSLTSIFLMYTATSIAKVFFITASVFGVMSLYGYTTKKDLSQMGSILMMGLFAVIIATVVNMFLKSSGLDFVLSIAGALIFTGLIAYDTQKLKSHYYQFSGQGSMLAKSAVLGALSLYLDFINLFLYLLKFMGQRRD